MTADVMSARNLFLQPCGLMVDRVLRIGNSHIQKWLLAWLAPQSALEAWTAEWHPMTAGEVLMQRSGARGGEDPFQFPVREVWSV